MVIGITGISGSGKTTFNHYMEDTYPETKRIDVDKIHIGLLIKEEKWLKQLYGEDILKDGKLNEGLFMSSPENIHKIFELSNDALVSALLDEINKAKNNYSFIILDSFALPTIPAIWNLCDIKILVSATNDEERARRIKARLDRAGSNQAVDLEKRKAISPDYSKYTFDYHLINNYDEQYFLDIMSLANKLKEMHNSIKM